ncbi:carbohydrate ABC transporter permease [Paenibacillus contaminans]|uniref:Carbohydrate ABC transporter permease n=1 Tax=Paenibacillus contaminans TaxID=450362 RepID=A0A329MLJ6_9BACL|nr:carbohydrate ABC transporter permease [Paenibacillus contaminans]RAV18747.1 carbohydrate ABC transporter permease [Paenibacillus contaminans]
MRKNRFFSSDTVFQTVNNLLLAALSLTFVLPFLVVLVTSLVGETELIRRGNFILIPEQFDFSAYKLLLSKDSLIYNAFGVTFLRVTIGTFLNLVFTAMTAYGLSRKNLPGRSIFALMVLITMFFEGGLIPSYLLIKGLHLTDSFWVMIVPGLISTWNMLIMRNFFSQLPEGLEESAMIDGASPFKILVRIVFPLSLPTFATIGLFYAVGHWNAWFDAVIYINDLNMQPLQVILRRIIISLSMEEINVSMLAVLRDQRPPAQSVKAAAIIVTTVPILFVYPFLQKHFAKGVLIGSIKG